LILPLIAGLALSLASGGASSAAKLEPKAACDLAAKVPEEGTYAVKGVYIADGMHGSMLELPACDRILFPEMDAAALARISEYHSAFAQKCGGNLVGDHIAGVFIGHFVQRLAQPFGWSEPGMVNFFVITDIESSDRDPAAITCPT
jgi:hypothetical protein